MMTGLYLLAAGIAGGFIGFTLKPSQRKNLPNWLLAGTLLFVLIVALQFVRASGGISIDIAPEYWAHFGAFVGGILLAATLVYQFFTFRRQKEQSEAQFRKTQLQSRFYEMIKYHRENVLEFKHTLPNYAEKTTVEGRKVFVEIYKQFLQVHKTVSDKKRLGSHNIQDISRLYASSNDPQIEKTRSGMRLSKDSEDDQKLFRQALIDISYHILFYGISGDQSTSPLLTLSRYNHEYLDEIFDELSTKRAKYDTRATGYVKFYGGHLYRLGHYFRHLFQTVKFIDQAKDLSYQEKYEYVKNLRAQLSTYEQILLYLDSVSELGLQWEFGNEKNYFITKYNLIQNIPVKMLPFEIIPTTFYQLIPFEDLNMDNLETRINFLQSIMPDEDLSFLANADVKTIIEGFNSSDHSISY